MRQPSTLLVTTVKDEGPFILEWVAWHRLCGFDRIMIFENNSTDLTRRSLRVMAQHGMIEFIPNEGGRNAPQIRAYARASASQAFADADWCLAIDGDEFFVSRLGDGSIGALTARLSNADAMLINWRNFGSAGQTDLSDELQAERFTRTHPQDAVKSHFVGFKSLFRPSAFARIGIHIPKHPRLDTPRLVSASGLEASDFTVKNWRSKDPGGMAWAQINHYPIRDAASFLLKTLRGRGHQDSFDDWERYWRRFDHNVVEDRSLADRVGDIRSEMARMDEVSEGRLALIRRKSHRIWRNKLAEALADPETRARHDRILSIAETSLT